MLTMRGVNWALRHECIWLGTCKIRRKFFLRIFCKTLEMRGLLLQVTQWSMHARQGMEITSQILLTKKCQRYKTLNVSIEYIFTLSMQHDPIQYYINTLLRVVGISGCFMFQFYLRPSVRNYYCTENIILVSEYSIDNRWNVRCIYLKFSVFLTAKYYLVSQYLQTSLHTSNVFNCFKERHNQNSKPNQQHRQTKQPWTSFSCSLSWWCPWYRSHRTRRIQS